MKKNLIVIIISFFTISTFSQNQITLEDIWENYKFYPNSYQGFKSMNDGKYYSKSKKEKESVKIFKHSFATGEITDTLMSSKDSRIIKMRSYAFSQDESMILISTKTESIYRHSSKSIYYIYDVISKQVTPLSKEKVMYASFSPDGKNIAYVLKNNLYIYNVNQHKTTQITKDGQKNKIINGASDWVYEEEFALVKSFSWSPDSKYIAFYKFDESKVKEFSMDLFKGGLYPTQDVFKYPKAGEENSKVSLHLYHLKNRYTKKIRFKKKYEYLPRIKWFEEKDPKLVVYGMNRLQNELDFIIVNTHGTGKVLFTEKDKYYIDIHDNLTYLSKHNGFIWTSEKDGYNHIYLKYLDGNEKQITKGSWEIKDFYGLDKDNNVYYSSNQGGSINKGIYQINLFSEDERGINLTSETGFNSAKFSNGMEYFMNVYSDHKTPPYITLNKGTTGKIIEVLEDNSNFLEMLKEYKLGKKEFFTIKTGENIELNAWMIKPANFNPNKEYPLYMFLYGGPGSQQVVDSWGWMNYFWYQMLAQQGYVVACVDNRGTGGKGSEFKKMTYQQLGKYETIDQINAAKYFGNLSYIDKSRIGIQGWSYGGYMSSLAITKGSDVFKMAIAVAPVTNWRYYDNIYTERFMRTPQENPSGYDDNSPINHVEKLKGNYLLIHGSADDNVHVQNTYEMVSALVRANKQFDLFIYPDKNHGIYGGNTRYHLYKRMTDFILENL